jgi:xylulokinase
VVTVKCTEGPALGVAALAAVGAGIYKDVPEACQTMVRDDMLLEPDPAMWAEYEKYYKIFRDLYPALKDSFARLAGL